MGSFQEFVAPLRSAVAPDRSLLGMQGSEMSCLVAPSKIGVAPLCYSVTGCPPLIIYIICAALRAAQSIVQFTIVCWYGLAWSEIDQSM